MTAGEPGQLGDRRGALPQPGFGEGVLLLIVMFAASAIALAAVLLGRRDTDLDVLLLGAVEVLGLLFGLVVGLRISRATWRETFLLKPVRGWMLLITILLTCAASIVAGALESTAGRVVRVPDLMAVEMARMLYAPDAAAWVRVVLTMAVVVPLGEELFFRGLLLRGFLLRYGPRAALVLTALLFAIVHLNPWALPSIFLVGLLLGWLVLRTGSLWCAWLAHGIYNLAAVVALNTALNGPPTVENLGAVAAGPLDGPVALAVALAALLLGLGLLAAHGRREAPWTLAHPLHDLSRDWTAPAREP
jgi:membrane protease YdiL (CAAX protease family)